MNNEVRLLLVLAAALMLSAGCSREQPNAAAPAAADTAAPTDRPKAKGRANAPQKLADDTVLVRCGTNEFTMGEARRLVALRVKLLQLSTPKGQNIQAGDALEARVLSSVPYGYPRDCAVSAFAAANGISAGKDEIELMRSRALQGAKQGFLSWPAFLRKLSTDERATMNERIQAEALTESVRRWHTANRPAKVTDEEIAQYRRRQRSYNAMAAATNDWTFVQATNVWQSLQKGLAFEEAVERYSTDESNTGDGVWGDFALDYFSDNAALKAALLELEPGQISPPVEGDNGLMILQLDDKRTESDGQAVYTLSRIFFHLPEFYPELDDATFAKEIREARQNRLFNDFVTELAAKNPPTYPSGEQVFENAKRTAAQPALF